MQSVGDRFILLVGILIGIFLVIALVVKFVTDFYIPFIFERDYIKMEIARSYGDERLYWQWKMKKLYVSSIPVIGKYLIKKKKK